MSSYSIKDLEKISGIKAHTIRIWEQRYKIIEPHRTDSNIRYYDDEHLKKLLNISILNRCGYKISNIARFNADELREKVLDVAQNIKDSDRFIEGLVVAAIEMSEDKFTKVINRAFFKHGFENTFTTTIFPFYRKIKLLWQVGIVNLAQKYYICGLIKQKIMVAIDSVDVPANNDAVFVLYLPENELVEICLLFYYYIIKAKGFKVVYMGHPFALNELAKIIDHEKQQYFITSFLNPLSQDELNDYYNKLSVSFPEKTFFVCGIEPEKSNFEPYINVRKLADYSTFKTFLSGLSASPN